MAKVYSKVLSYTDQTQKFTVPSHWLEEDLLPKLKSNEEATIRVLDQRGCEFRFVLKARETKADQPYLKPVFQSQEWLEFVRAHGLVAKDTVYFWKERRGNDDIILVHVRDQPKVHKLMGFNVSPPTNSLDAS